MSAGKQDRTCPIGILRDELLLAGGGTVAFPGTKAVITNRPAEKKKGAESKTTQRKCPIKRGVAAAANAWEAIHTRWKRNAVEDVCKKVGARFYGGRGGAREDLS